MLWAATISALLLNLYGFQSVSWANAMGEQGKKQISEWLMVVVLHFRNGVYTYL
jgi:hypothetical protein